MKIGETVVFVDEVGHASPALITAVWEQHPDSPSPSLNLVLVHKDETMKDTYGRQIERRTSISHQTQQFAPAFYWKRIDE